MRTAGLPSECLKLLQRLEQPAAEARDPLRDRVDADLLEVAQADLHRRDPEVVHGAVLEAGVAGVRHDHVALHVRGDDGAAAEPRPLQALERPAPDDQRAQARRVAEHLVEGDRDEVRLPHRQVEPARRRERGAVQEHVPAPLMGQVDPLQRMLDAREVGLRGIGEEAGAVGLVEVIGELVHAQLGRLDRHVRRRGAPRAGELPEAVDRVVVVGGGEEPCRTDTPRRRAGSRRWRSA